MNFLTSQTKIILLAVVLFLAGVVIFLSISYQQKQPPQQKENPPLSQQEIPTKSETKTFPNSFSVAIGGDRRDEGRSIIQTTDGGFAITGRTESFGRGSDVYIIKLDSNGNIQWTKTVGGNYWDIGYSIVQTTDGGFAIVGFTGSFVHGSRDVYIIKLDSSGNLQWTKTIGGNKFDVGNSIIQTTDGGFVIVGYTESFGQGDDVYIIKLDSSGNLQWTRTIGGNHLDEGYSIIQTNDGGFAIVGYTWSFGNGRSDVYIIKLDSSGHLQWTKTIGGNNLDEGYSIIQTTDGGFAIAGYIASFEQNGDVYIIKLDSAGNLQWIKTIGGKLRDIGYSIIQTTDGGFAIVGSTESFGRGGDVYIIKLDSSGNLQWTRTIGGNHLDEGYSIIQTTDGGFAIAGSTTSFGQGGSDVYIIKLDANGNGCNVFNVDKSRIKVSSGGVINSGGGVIGSGGIVGSGGYVSSGGSVKQICPFTY